MKRKNSLNSGRDRQRLWKERQKQEGRKILTISLSRQAKEILEKEKERTSDTFSAIIDKALINVRRNKAGVRPGLINAKTSNDLLATTGVDLILYREKYQNNEGKVVKRVQSEEDFRSFFETASDLMCMTDEYGNLTYVNNSFAATLGYAKEEIIGMHITQILHKKSVVTIQRNIY